MSPDYIAAGSDGAIWFTTSDPQDDSLDPTGMIDRVSTAGVITEFPLPAGTVANDLISGHDGNLWFAATTNVGTTQGSAIGRITPSGVVTLFSLSPDDFASQITAAPDGSFRVTGLFDQNGIYEAATWCGSRPRRG